MELVTSPPPLLLQKVPVVHPLLGYQLRNAAKPKAVEANARYELISLDNFNSFPAEDSP